MAGRRTVKPAANSTQGEPIVAHGWSIGVHPLLLDQLTRLTAAASREEVGGPNRKLLGHVLDLMLESIPQDPGNARYRHGGAIGGAHRDWFRGKTGNGRYRLFYRYSSSGKAIIYAWLNDQDSLRSRGAKTDAYQVFAKMLAAGDPPSEWAGLKAATESPTHSQRVGKALGEIRKELK